jgi:exonuclease III/predicted nucleic-acid-binding Zn-ribbon protein
MTEIENEWGMRGYWSLGSYQSKGVAILFKSSLNVTHNCHFRDSDGRLVVVNMKIGDENFRLINIYAPNKARERYNFFKAVEDRLHAPGIRVLVAGDFNCVEDASLDRITTPGNRTVFYDIKLLTEWSRTYAIEDVFRRLHPQLRVMTWRAGNVAARLDRFYMHPDTVAMVTDVTTNICADSDHSIVIVSLDAGKLGIHHGPGYWKLNATVLQDEYTNSDMLALIDQMTKSQVKNIAWWETCKRRFKELLTIHSKRLAKNRCSEQRECEAELTRLERLSVANPNLYNERINCLKCKIKQFADYQIEGAKVRAKITYLDKEEKPTTFFFQTEKCRAAKHTLKTLKTADGKQATTTAELLEQSRAFYADLFTEEAIDLSLADYFVVTCQHCQRRP